MKKTFSSPVDHGSARSDEKKLTRAIIWAALSNWSAEAISSVVILILASLLRPADFGLVAMATAYIAFLEMVLGFGLDTAIIQKKQLAAGHLDSIFWLILIASTCCVGLSVALSGLWATSYGIPKLKLVIICLSAGLPLQGLITVQQALFQRKMDFRSLAMRNNGAIIAGALVGIGMAISGFGVWALVGQNLARQAIGVLLLWTISDWRPSLHFSFGETTELLRFSGKVFLASLAGFFHSQSDALLIGLFFGPTAVGIFRLGDRLVRMVLKLLTRAVQVVALPHFATFQHDKEQLKSALVSCWRKSAALTIPAMFLLSGISDDFVRFIGPQWVLAADVVKFLSIVGIAMSISLFTGPILQAAGRPGLQAAMAWLLAFGITVAFIIVGLLTRQLTGYWQVTLMAASRAGVFVLLFLPVNLTLARLVTGVSYRDLFAVTWRTILIGINIFVLVKYSAVTLRSFHAPLVLKVLVESLVGFSVWGASLFLLDQRIRKQFESVSRNGFKRSLFSLSTLRQIADL